MRVLIIDDLQEKVKWIKDILEEKKIEYDQVTYLNSAYKKILNTTYDGIILDMNFPRYKDSTVVNNAGEILLKILKHRKIEIPVLGNSTVLNFPTSNEYPFIKGHIAGYKVLDKERLINFLESIEKEQPI